MEKGINLKYKGVDFPVDGCDCFCCMVASGELGGINDELLGPAKEDKDGIIEALRTTSKKRVLKKKIGI